MPRKLFVLQLFLRYLADPPRHLPWRVDIHGDQDQDKRAHSGNCSQMPISEIEVYEQDKQKGKQEQSQDRDFVPAKAKDIIPDAASHGKKDKQQTPQPDHGNRFPVVYFQVTSQAAAAFPKKLPQIGFIALHIFNFYPAHHGLY